MTTCEPSQMTDSGQMELTGLTLCAVVSLVNRSPLPGSSEAKTITVTSGRKCSGLYRKSGPLGLSVKMLLGSLTWNSAQCLLTWRAQGTRSNRLLFRLVPSVPLRDATGFGFWPTPQAGDALNFNIRESQRNYDNLAGEMLRKGELVGGSLNPEWIEWLMGYPSGWTELEDLETQ